MSATTVETLERIILVHGLQRSGSHAIVYWIQGETEIPLFKNLVPIGPILSGHAAMPNPRDFAGWLQEPAQTKRMRRAPRRDQIIVGLEDHALDLVPFSGVPCPIVNVLILRDPFNLFASRIRRAAVSDAPQYAPRHIPRAVELWKRHALEFLDRTRLLENKVCVYYNEWFRSRTYRERTSATLGFENCEARFARVPGAGGGSSFDGRRFYGRNTEMNVLDRVSQLHPDERRLLDASLGHEDIHGLAAAVRDATSDSPPDAKPGWSNPRVLRTRQREP